MVRIELWLVISILIWQLNKTSEAKILLYEIVSLLMRPFITETTRFPTTIFSTIRNKPISFTIFLSIKLDITFTFLLISITTSTFSFIATVAWLFATILSMWIREPISMAGSISQLLNHWFTETGVLVPTL